MCELSMDLAYILSSVIHMWISIIYTYIYIYTHTILQHIQLDKSVPVAMWGHINIALANQVPKQKKNEYTSSSELKVDN